MVCYKGKKLYHDEKKIIEHKLNEICFVISNSLNTWPDLELTTFPGAKSYRASKPSVEGGVTVHMPSLTSS